MKKILVYLTICIISVLLLVSCSWLGSGGDKEPVIPTAVLTINPEEEIYNYGDTVTVIWEGIDGEWSILNGQTERLYGKKYIQLLKDTLFTLRVTNGQLSDTTAKLIRVNDWTSSRLGLFTYHIWQLGAINIWQNDEMVADLILDDEQKNQTIKFLPNGKTESGDKWSFSKDGTHLLIGDTYLISTLTSEKLALDIESSYNGKPAVFRQEYYRP